MTQPWPAETLWEQLEPLVPGLNVEVVAETDSTNTRLLERARAGDSGACLMVAERQTAGRGRLGRSWESAPGASLTFSLALPLAPADWSGLSLVVGVALAEALHPQLRLKWPNDLWLSTDAGRGRKLGGILIETALARDRRVAVIGVGLNISGVQDDPTADVGRAGLAELDPQATAPEALLRIAPPLLRAVLAFEREGFAPWQARYAARDVLAGRRVRLLPGQAGADEGVVQGVNSQGGLLVHTAAGLLTITSGEVSVRPC
jgi:BirA family biotin operon repressor/biotin-[acetyl-CoA-carboxylase] ligase